MKCICLAVMVGGAVGHSSYISNIPNGNAVQFEGSGWAGVGHQARGGGGTRNNFGIEFAAAGHTWTVDLCNSDSDGDGASNGLELGDPDCVWTSGATPSRTTDITHPGEASESYSPPVPTPAPPPTPAPLPDDDAAYPSCGGGLAAVTVLAAVAGAVHGVV